LGRNIHLRTERNQDWTGQGKYSRTDKKIKKVYRKQKTGAVRLFVFGDRTICDCASNAPMQNVLIYFWIFCGKQTQNKNISVKVKVKPSRYTPWRRLGGEEV
jgi:hypothetical protein